jgi:pimeloyl-ACP methyl ester carboxylesterase
MATVYPINIPLMKKTIPKILRKRSLLVVNITINLLVTRMLKMRNASNTYLWILSALLISTSVNSVECNNHNGFICSDSNYQFSDNFINQNKYPHGGFGGGNCQANKTPVIFLHGNGDNAIGWAIPPSITLDDYPQAPFSVYESFKQSGYNDCELFGLTYLSIEQRQSPQLNYHDASSQDMINQFINDVLAYTQQKKVNIVAHSLGVSMALSSLYKHQTWDKVERFINIAGAVRGLQSCLYTGYANALAPTCGSQNIYDANIFGLYPDNGSFSPMWGKNAWTGSYYTRSMRNLPANHPENSFYSLTAGSHDQIHCTTTSGRSTCVKGALFNSSENVISQLGLGAGTTASELDFNFSDLSPYNLSGGDLNGIGHFNSKINSGAIVVKMLTSNCKGSACAVDYLSGPVTNAF